VRCCARALLANRQRDPPQTTRLVSRKDLRLLDVELMISNGADTNRYRDIAVNVAADVEHLFTYELGQTVGIRAWDYRNDNPHVVTAGALAARSLSMQEGN
jgi:hypothetical protein